LDVGLASLDERLACIETSRNDDPRTVKFTQEVCDLLEPQKRPKPRERMVIPPYLRFCAVWSVLTNPGALF
jgi:hypothetical protein